MQHADLTRLREALDRAVVGLEAAKRRLLERAALAAAVPEARGPAVLLVGPPGSGKDALLAAVAEGLGGPVPRVALESLAAEARPAAVEEALALAAKSPLVVVTGHHPSDVGDGLARRFEPVELHGYARAEKLEIARRRLLPRALAALGPLGAAVEVAPDALARLVERYAPEAGAAGLERRIEELVRRAAARVALGEAPAVRVDGLDLKRLLGPPPADAPARDFRADIGVATGLSWTREGGQVVLVEALRTRDPLRPGGPPDGLAGAVEAALAYIRGRADELRIDPDALRASDVLVRATGPASLPDGGGLDLAVFLALVSLASDRPVRGDVAAAGAITLRGSVLATEGVPAKVLAAERAGFRKVLVPRADFAALEATLAPATLASLEVVPVDHAQEAAREALIDIVIARGIK